MKLSPGLEFLISRQGIQPSKEEKPLNLIDLNPAVEMGVTGPRVIATELGRVQVHLVRPLKKKGEG